VRGQHEADPRRARPPPELVGRHVGEDRERVVERLARRRRLACLLASAPQAVVLLRDVRQLEVEAERAQDERLLVAAQLRDRVLDLAHLAAPARGARHVPHPLDVVEQLLADLLDEHPPEDRPEQADVAPQRLVCRSALHRARVRDRFRQRVRCSSRERRSARRVRRPRRRR
jgi:hypothetical protein